MVAVSRKLRGERVRSVRVSANGPVRLVRRNGRLYAAVDLRKLRGKTLTLRITRRLAGGRVVTTRHSRLVCR